MHNAGRSNHNDRNCHNWNRNLKPRLYKKKQNSKKWTKDNKLTRVILAFWNPALRNDSYLLICSSVNCDRIELRIDKKRKKKKKRVYDTIWYEK